MARTLSTLRGKLPSTRAMLVLGGIAAAAVGAVATTDTMAASTDSGTAQVSQIATENFFPTPVIASLTCRTDPNEIWYDLTASRANLEWPAAPNATGYRAEFVLDNGSVVHTENLSSTQTTLTGIRWRSERKVQFVRIRTVNNGQVSSGYRAAGITHKDLVSNRTTCTGNYQEQGNAAWENQAAWTPGAPQARSAGLRSIFVPPAEPSPAPSTTESEKPEVTAPETIETQEPSTSTEPSTSPSQAPSESATPSQTPSESSEAAQPITAAIEVNKTKRTLILSRGATQICTLPLAEGDVYSFNGDNLAITNGGAVKKIDPETCAVI